MSPTKSTEREALESEINEIRAVLRRKEEELRNLVRRETVDYKEKSHSLSNEEIARYSRQLIIPSVGILGQELLKSSSVLIVGCGGLGCPSAQYLAACGIGKLGLVDYDEVELSNLHRQILHEESSVGEAKVTSIAFAIKRLNKNVEVEEYKVQLDSSNALSILAPYNVVIDATDNVATRYLLNDACVLLGKPLVSGSAVQTEGQLTVYNYHDGPCYRCLFPNPPPPATVMNCGDSGVLGPIAGVIGVLEAQQAIHVLLETDGVLVSRLLSFDGCETHFRTFKLRGKRSTCDVCGSQPKITQLIDYEQFCGAPATDKGAHVSLLSPEDRITPSELSKVMMHGSPHRLLDCRSEVEFDICHIPGSTNVPINTINKGKEAVVQLVPDLDKEPVYVICRRGNDSQIAVAKLREYFPQGLFKDLQGGLHSWSHVVDETFPVY